MYTYVFTYQYVYTHTHIYTYTYIYIHISTLYQSRYTKQPLNRLPCHKYVYTLYIYVCTILWI